MKESLDAAFRARSEALGQKIGPFLGPVRVAITGASVSPPLVESMLVLGKQETLARLDNALKFLG